MKTCLKICVLIAGCLFLLHCASKPEAVPSAIPYYNHGVELQEAGNLEDAIAAYTRALKIDPYFVDALVNRGNIQMDMGNLYEAIEDYTRALALEPDHIVAYLNRSSAYAQEGDLDSAIEDLTTAIVIKPDYASAYFSRGIVWMAKKYYDQAIADFTKAADLDLSRKTAAAEKIEICLSKKKQNLTESLNNSDCWIICRSRLVQRRGCGA